MFEIHNGRDPSNPSKSDQRRKITIQVDRSRSGSSRAKRITKGRWVRTRNGYAQEQFFFYVRLVTNRSRKQSIALRVEEVSFPDTDKGGTSNNEPRLYDGRMVFFVEFSNIMAQNTSTLLEPRASEGSLGAGLKRFCTGT